MSIFNSRIAYKPFEYPEVVKLTDLISGTYWVHNELNFTADLQEFHTQLTDAQRYTVEMALKSISQIEVSVKSFWGDLYKHLPKPEFNGLGSCYADCEWRHSEAYSRLLDVIGISDYNTFCAKPPIEKRINQLNYWLSAQSENKKETFLKKVIVFAVLIENVSLFSQFAIMRSFNRFHGTMKNISNVVNWTANDENIHAIAGIWIANLIIDELNYDREKLRAWLVDIVEQSLETEGAIIDMIYEKGELPWLSKEQLLSFLKYRIDESFIDLGMEPYFKASPALLWFYEETGGLRYTDAFAKRPTEYTKRDKSFTGDDLF